MMEFSYPANIIFIAPAAAAVLFFVLAFGKKERIMAALSQGYKSRFKALRSVLLGAGFSLMAFSLLGLQLFTGYANVMKSGLDVYVLMDTSKSMLVNDVQPDRISMAKKIVENLLSELDGDRVGFIPFASDAYIQMPLTDDYQMALMFLDVMDTDMIGGGGSDIASALRLANLSFDQTAAADRVVLILSDGEEHDTDSMNALNNINDDRMKVYTIGVGTEKGGLVPIYDEVGDIADYIKNEDGNPVTSRLDSSTLILLAQSGNGKYYQAGGTGTEAKILAGDLAGLKRGSLEAKQIKKFEPIFQYFLGTGILLIVLAWFLGERRAAV
jgi:Ca-activated chloride channel family protein